MSAVNEMYKMHNELKRGDVLRLVMKMGDFYPKKV